MGSGQGLRVLPGRASDSRVRNEGRALTAIPLLSAFKEKAPWRLILEQLLGRMEPKPEFRLFIGDQSLL